MQVNQIVAAAECAPYGHGEATVFDETVRKYWQVDAADLVIERENWEKLLKKWLNLDYAIAWCVCFTTEAQGRVYIYVTAVLTGSKVRASPKNLFMIFFES